jgi:hypothetical protein
MHTKLSDHRAQATRLRFKLYGAIELVEIFESWGGIDDGGWYAYVPLTDDFILSPCGKFIDE